MSDIQEEQKRLYKKAEENDIKLLQDRINKYKQALLDIKEIINEQINYNFSQYAAEKMLDEIMETINKELGDNK